jgi:hypothetical protein
VRAYAALELARAGERDDAFEGLVRYSTAEASLAVEGLVGPAQVEWLDRVRQDLESHRAALTWLFERHRSGEAIDIAWGLLFFWLIRGCTAEGLRWYEALASAPSLPPAAESKARLGAGVMLYTHGEHVRARASLARALKLAHSVGEMVLVAQAEQVFAHLEYAAGNMSEAGHMFTRSEAGFRRLGVPWGTGLAMSGMAGVAVARGDVAHAEGLLDDAAAVLRDAGPWFLSLGLYVRAILAIRSGNPDRAIALARHSLSHIRELHDAFALVYTLVPLAAAAALKGNGEWAARILGARDAVMERTAVAIVDSRVHDLRGWAEREARARIDPDRWAAAYDEGRASSIDALLEDIDRVRRAPAAAGSHSVAQRFGEIVNMA